MSLQSQANAPVANYGTFGAPANRVRVACESLSDSSLEGDELMAAMVRALAAFSGNATVTRGCLDITDAAAQPEPEPGSAEAPAGEPAGPLPDAAPEAEAVPVSGGSRKQATPAGDAVFQYSSDQKFAYQVRHAVCTVCLPCWHCHPIAVAILSLAALATADL